MKRKIFGGVLVWLLLVSLSHVTLNIGWQRLAQRFEVLLGERRAELVVGFLPVT